MASVVLAVVDFRRTSGRKVLVKWRPDPLTLRYLTLSPVAHATTEITKIAWSPRAQEALDTVIDRNAGICYLVDLAEGVTASELSTIKHCGNSTILEIVKVLKHFGLSMKLGKRFMTPGGPHYDELMTMLVKD